MSIAIQDSTPIKGKTICMLSSVHSATDVRIYEREAQSLAAAGYKVKIVAQHDGDQMKGPVQIIAIPHQASRLRRMTIAIWDVYREARKIDAVVYHFHDPELIPIGLLLKLEGKQVIYDVHEDVPRDILVKNWIAPLLRKPLALGAAFVHFVSALAFDGIVAATPVIAFRFRPSRAVAVQNFPHVKELDEDRPRSYADRKCIATYVGGLTRQRGVEQMVQAMSILPNFPEARLILAGQFEETELQQELRQLPGFGRVDYLGWLTRMEVEGVLDTARVGLVLFHPFQNYMEAQPNKLFEYMRAGIPVIASDFPLWREIIGDAGCGLLVDPLNPGDIARAIEWVFRNPDEAEEMGRRGAAAVRSKYNWQQESQELLNLYGKLTGGTQDSPHQN